MVVLDHVEDELGETSLAEPGDEPPSYETITGDAGEQSSNNKSGHTRSDENSPYHNLGQSTTSIVTNTNTTARRPPQPGPSTSSWRFAPPSTSSRTSTQIRQTVLSLVRNIVVNPDSPNILNSCADVCKTHSLKISSILQERSIENHTPMYWAIVNNCHALLPLLLGYAAPLSHRTVSDIRLACLASSNQQLFQALRCRREPFANQKTLLTTGPGADAIILGSMPPDDVTIQEASGENTFVAEMRINMWQKRMRICGRVNVEFIARGRIWFLIFFSAPPSGSINQTVGTWQVALCICDHSPATFVDSILVIDVPPQASPQDLISLSTSHSASSGSGSGGSGHGEGVGHTSPSGLQAESSSRTTSEPKSSPSIRIRMKHGYRLAYRPPDSFITTPSRDGVWGDGRELYTSAIIARLGGVAEQLMYDNTKYIDADGSLHARFGARLAKPEATEATECIIC